MFVEIHFLQNFAPSNLNRDDTGNPKDAYFGGVRRARISSQAIKRAIRLAPVFAQTTQVPPAVRTRWMTRRLAEKLQAAGKPQEEAQRVAHAFAWALTTKEKKGKNKKAASTGDKEKAPERTSVLLYLSDEEYARMAEALLAQWEAAVAALPPDGQMPSSKAEPFASLVKAWLKETKNRTSAPDIALFGRMLANKPELNLDAACQVAHALSTHRVEMEFDFFTAVDDLLTDEEAGSGMMGITPFNSATYYRYARLDWEQLVKNLDGDVGLACRTVEAFCGQRCAPSPRASKTLSPPKIPPTSVWPWCARMAWPGPWSMPSSARCAPTTTAGCYARPSRPWMRIGGV